MAKATADTGGKGNGVLPVGKVARAEIPFGPGTVGKGLTEAGRLAPGVIAAFKRASLASRDAFVNKLEPEAAALFKKFIADDRQAAVDAIKAKPKVDNTGASKQAPIKPLTKLVNAVKLERSGKAYAKYKATKDVQDVPKTARAIAQAKDAKYAKQLSADKMKKAILAGKKTRIPYAGKSGTVVSKDSGRSLTRSEEEQYSTRQPVTVTKGKPVNAKDIAKKERLARLSQVLDKGKPAKKQPVVARPLRVKDQREVDSRTNKDVNAISVDPKYKLDEQREAIITVRKLRQKILEMRDRKSHIADHESDASRILTNKLRRDQIKLDKLIAIAKGKVPKTPKPQRVEVPKVSHPDNTASENMQLKDEEAANAIRNRKMQREYLAWKKGKNAAKNPKITKTEAARMKAKLSVSANKKTQARIAKGK